MFDSTKHHNLLTQGLLYVINIIHNRTNKSTHSRVVHNNQ